MNELEDALVKSKNSAVSNDKLNCEMLKHMLANFIAFIQQDMANRWDTSRNGNIRELFQCTNQTSL